MKREAYCSVDVKQVWVESLVMDRPGEAASVGLDIAKNEVLAVVRCSDSSFEQPWRAKNDDIITVSVPEGRLSGLNRPSGTTDHRGRHQTLGYYQMPLRGREKPDQASRHPN
jgi:hypothetical protein